MISLKYSTVEDRAYGFLRLFAARAQQRRRCLSNLYVMLYLGNLNS